MKLIVPTVALSVVSGATTVYAQTVRERTIEEIKTEAQARAERGGYPLIGLDPADVLVELGHRRVVGGQEDMIVDVAAELAAARIGAESG